MDGFYRSARFVLVEPAHPGNIGAAARALHAMGFHRLVLVAPADRAWRVSGEARALAASAHEVLAGATECATLVEALEGATLALAMSGYEREFGPPAQDLREAAAQAVAQAQEVAFVFGTERTGLSNEDVRRCHRIGRIESDEVHGSLNLAQAVQVAAYEMRRAILASRGALPAAPPRRDAAIAAARGEDPPAGIERTEAMFEHLERGLLAIGALDPQAPRNLMARLRRLLLRAAPTAVEVDILRGIAAAMEKPRSLRAGRKAPPR